MAHPNSNQGQAVGTGSSGGVLISDGHGGTTEVFQSRPDQPSDPGRSRFIRGGGGPGDAQRRAEAQRKIDAQKKIDANIKRIDDKKKFDTTIRWRKKPLRQPFGYKPPRDIGPGTAQEERWKMSIPESLKMSIPMSIPGSQNMSIPEGQRLLTAKEVKALVSEVQPRPEVKGFMNITTSKLGEFRSKAITETGLKKETIIGQTKGYIGGAGLSAIGTVTFAKNLWLHPVKTGIKTIKSIPSIPGQLKLVGPMIIAEPSFAFGFLSMEILTAKGIGKGISIVSPKKIVTKTPTRKVKTPQALEIKYPIVTASGKPQTLSSFKIVGEVSPPIRTITTTKLRRLTGSAPISTTISKPVRFVQETIAPIINQRPFMVRQVIEGKKGQTFLNVRGLSREVSVSQIAGTSKLEQFAFKKLVEQKTGRPMSITTATKVTPKTSKISFGEIVQEKSFISKPSKTKTGITFDIQPIKPGRRTSRQILVSRTSKMIDAPKFKTSFVETQFKDITFPGARATGKSQRLKQTIISFKEPRIYKTPKHKKLGNLLFERNIPVRDFSNKLLPYPIKKEVLGFTMRSGGSKGVVFVKKGLKESKRSQVIAHEKGHIFTLDRLSDFKVNKKVSKEFIESKFGKGTYTDKQIKAEFLAEKYSGKTQVFKVGVFEDLSKSKLFKRKKIIKPLLKPAPPKTIGTKTTTQIIKTTTPGTPQVFAVSTTLIGTPKKTTKILTKTFTIQKPSATSIQKPSLFVSQKPAIKLAQKPSIKLAGKTSIKLAQKPLTKLAQKPALKIAQKTTLKQMFKFTTTPTGIPKFPFASKPKDPFTPIPKSLKGGKKKKKKGGLFTVEVRRRGEFKTVGITGDIFKAVSIGKGITASTLGATFRIKGAKKGSVGMPSGFRLPRASSKIAGPLTFIEKSKFRLSRAGEIGEIQRARRMKTTRRKKKQ